MKKINIKYKEYIFEVNVSYENAYPNNLLKIEFENNLKLLEILRSPVYIEEKKGLLSFKHIEVINQNQRDLLDIIASGIENQFYEVK
jgi:hypothetical protein